MTVRLERMRWWHLDAVLSLERRLFPEPWSPSAFWSELGQLDTRCYLVALEDGGAGRPLVGYAGLCDYPDDAWIQTVAVAPAAQGRGIGSALLGALLAEAERRGQRVVQLEVRAGNETAQRLYARHGFTRAGLRRGYYSGGREDALLMTRRSTAAEGA